MRCVEVNFGEMPSGVQELNALLHRAMSIQHRTRGLGWEYGETRPSEGKLRVAYYRYFDSGADFTRELDRLRQWLGPEYSAVDVPCVSAYDELATLDEG